VPVLLAVTVSSSRDEPPPSRVTPTMTRKPVFSICDAPNKRLFPLAPHATGPPDRRGYSVVSMV
jgi:hypothetical protein